MRSSACSGIVVVSPDTVPVPEQLGLGERDVGRGGRTDLDRRARARRAHDHLGDPGGRPERRHEPDAGLERRELLVVLRGRPRGPGVVVRGAADLARVVRVARRVVHRDARQLDRARRSGRCGRDGGSGRGLARAGGRGGGGGDDQRRAGRRPAADQRHRLEGHERDDRQDGDHEQGHADAQLAARRRVVVLALLVVVRVPDRCCRRRRAGCRPRSGAAAPRRPRRPRAAGGPARGPRRRYGCRRWRRACGRPARRARPGGRDAGRGPRRGPRRPSAGRPSARRAWTRRSEGHLPVSSR